MNLPVHLNNKRQRLWALPVIKAIIVIVRSYSEEKMKENMSRRTNIFQHHTFISIWTVYHKCKDTRMSNGTFIFISIGAHFKAARMQFTSCNIHLLPDVVTHKAEEIVMAAGKFTHTQFVSLPITVCEVKKYKYFQKDKFNFIWFIHYCVTAYIHFHHNINNVENENINIMKINERQNYLN